MSDGCVAILSVGELNQNKNHVSVIKAIKILDNPKYHYFIAGSGKLEGYLKKTAKELNLDKQVHFLGYRKDMKELYDSADIFIMPSVREGLSVALMEAMACGRAVVASRIRGNVDLIDEGKGGLLGEVYNVEKYAEMIDELSRSAEQRKEFGLYNKEKMKQFDIRRVKKLLGDILCGCGENEKPEK